MKEISGVRFCCSRKFLIGEGNGGARVYIGLGKDGCEKAVKRILKDSFDKSDLAEHEKTILRQKNAIKSNNVVNYWFLDDESEDDFSYLILDLCEENLEDYVERTDSEKLKKEAPDIIKQILKGLADLHGNSPPILHRDVKPKNILQDVEGNWLLADFGLSRLLTGGVNTHRSIQRGTEDWRAVESYPSNEMDVDADDVRYKKESDVQVEFAR